VQSDDKHLTAKMPPTSPLIGWKAVVNFSDDFPAANRMELEAALDIIESSQAGKAMFSDMALVQSQFKQGKPLTITYSATRRMEYSRRENFVYADSEDSFYINKNNVLVRAQLPMRLFHELSHASDLALHANTEINAKPSKMEVIRAETYATERTDDYLTRSGKPENVKQHYLNGFSEKLIDKLGMYEGLVLQSTDVKLLLYTRFAKFESHATPEEIQQINDVKKIFSEKAVLSTLSEKSQIKPHSAVSNSVIR
jgi:Effector protein